MHLSLRVKMIGTTAALLIFTVALFAVLQVRSATADLEAETGRLRELQLQQAKQLSQRTVASVASSSYLLIADNDFATLAKQIEPIVEDARASDLRVREALITNERGEVLAFAAPDDATPRPERLDTADLKDLHAVQTQIGASDADGVPADITVTAPILDREEKLWGYTRFVYELPGLRKDLDSIEERAVLRRAEIIQSNATIGALFLVLGVVMAVLQSIAISRPIMILAAAARRIAQGDLAARAPVRGRDEIATLSSSFNDMAERVTTLLRDTAAKTAMEKELEVARVIQETLLPPTGLVDVGSLRFAGFFRSASLCGGDFWTWFDLQDGRIFLGVGDVTGHGVPSAMITAACKSGLNTLRSVSHNNIRIAPLMEELNKTIHEAARRKFFMTFFGLIFHPDTRTIEFANAGHNFPLVVRRHEGELRAQALIARGNRLGDLKDSRFAARTEQLHPGDLICLYTDGITEYRDKDGKEFGERRLRKLLEKVWALEPDAAIQHIIGDLRAFAGDAVQEDDITLVIAKVRG